MKTLVMLFVSSAAFGSVLSVAYWIVTRGEVAGSLLLGFFAASLIFSAAYALIAERGARLSGDAESGRAGEDLGIFTAASAWPILLALSVTIALLGLVWVPLVAVAGAALSVLCLWRLGAESSRI